MKRKYFHNNIEGVQQTEFCDVDFRAIYADMTTWELPSTCVALIRSVSPEGLISEYSYKQRKAAQKKIFELVTNGHQVLVTDQTTMVGLNDYWNDTEASL